MAETVNNKPTIQLRGISNGNGNGNGPSPLPSPGAKLLINHGKPNFTIPSAAKAQDNDNAVSPQPTANNNYNAFKSASSNNNIVVGTKFNGVFKPANVGSWATQESENEIEPGWVALRRPKLAQPPSPAADGDENVPEFIRRQRRIQERLAKENVLDFENRRSGYFTHVMISPDSPNPTSFVETMASPAIVPALEMPVPVSAKIVEEEPKVEEVVATSAPLVETEPQVLEEEQQQPLSNGHSLEPVSNGHVENDVVPDDVAQAIEEVNKAVAGEEDDKSADEQIEPEAQQEVQAVAVTSAVEETAAAPVPVEANVEVVTPVVAADVVENGHAADAAITISHTNGHTDVPSIPAPDPSGALGVNFEPKTVVSFAQELGGGDNNYPDTVKVLKDAPTTPANEELQELTKLKFDIKSDEANEVQVTPVLRAAE